MNMTSSQIVAEIASFARSAAPFLPPGMQLAVTLATNAMQAVRAAQNDGKDVTPEQLAALFAADDQAKADDLLAQNEAAAAAARANPKPKP